MQCKQGAKRKFHNMTQRTSYGRLILLICVAIIFVHLLFFPKAMTGIDCKGRSSDLFYFLRPSHPPEANSGIGCSKSIFRTYSYGYSLGFTPNSLFISILNYEEWNTKCSANIDKKKTYKHKSQRINADRAIITISTQYARNNKKTIFWFKKIDAEPRRILTYILQQIFKMNSPNEIDLLSLHIAFFKLN